jgi:cell division protein FtsW
MLKDLEKYDMIILLMAVALTCFGVVMVYSTSSVMAAKKFHDGFYFLKRQGIYALLGFGAMIFAMRFDYQTWRRFAVPILLGCIVLLLLVFIPGIGAKAKGAARWIRLPGFNLQPSELAKIALIVYMAYSLDKKQDQGKMKLFFAGFAPYMVILALMLGILLKQHDLGSALTLFFVAFMMLFIAGAQLRYILGFAVLTIPFLWYFVVSEPYRWERIKAYLDPWQDPTGTGFQIIQSWIAVGTGGIFGQGLGESKQKLFYLPEAHTDFILAVAGEELGFVGIAVIASMFFLLVLRSIRVALYAEDTFGRFLAYGIAVLLGTEAFFNMAVVTGMVPTKGLALPFISYGGSSLIVTLFAIGILLNVSSRMRGAP